VWLHYSGGMVVMVWVNKGPIPKFCSLFSTNSQFRVVNYKMENLPRSIASIVSIVACASTADCSRRAALLDLLLIAVLKEGKRGRGWGGGATQGGNELA
jgi:hypothetical protein